MGFPISAVIIGLTILMIGGMLGGGHAAAGFYVLMFGVPCYLFMLCLMEWLRVYESTTDSRGKIFLYCF